MAPRYYTDILYRSHFVDVAAYISLIVCTDVAITLDQLYSEKLCREFLINILYGGDLIIFPRN